MEENKETLGMLDLMIQPAFTVKDGKIDQLNDGARKYYLEAGMQIVDLLLTGKKEYQQLQGLKDRW